MSKAVLPRQTAPKRAFYVGIPARFFHFLGAELKYCDNVETKHSNIVSVAALPQRALLNLPIALRVNSEHPMRALIAPQVD